MKVPGILIHTFLIVGLLYGNISRAQDGPADSTNSGPRFKRLSKVQQKYLGWVDKKDREFPMGVPLIAGNKYDGLSVGAALINLRQPVKHLDFTGLMLYGTQSKKVTGVADLDYYIKPKHSIVREIKPGIHFQSFSYENIMFPSEETNKFLKYYALNPEISLELGSKGESGEKFVHLLDLRSHVIFKQEVEYAFSEADSTIEAEQVLDKFYANQLAYTFKRRDPNYPMSVSLTLEQTREFVKTWVELKSFIRYGFRDHFTGIQLRYFMGGFLYRNPDTRFRLYPNYGFSLSGMTGEDDYLYENHYVGRTETEGLAARQITQQEGFLKVVTPQNAIPVGQTVDFLMAADIIIDFPVKYFPIKLFFDLGYSVDKHLNPDNFLPVKGFQYDGGFMFSFLDRAVEFYFPLFMSKDYKAYYDANLPKFKQRVSFMVDLAKLMLHKRIRDMKF